ncbi:MAG: transcription termination/antitermination NusG family protein [Acidobacteriota bacterium]|nr:transcription termination/antitermination NusG family protein [Acidobacteriota bacterium]
MVDLKWYLVTTKLKSELRVRENLQRNHNLETFFPHYAPKKAGSPVGLPLFARYVFVHCDPERDFRKIQYTPGVSRIVTFGDAVIPVPDDVVEGLKLRCGENDQVLPPDLAAGQKVRVKHGVFDGFEGIIQEKRGNKRIQLLLELAYGNELKVEVDASEVEPTRASYQ